MHNKLIAAVSYLNTVPMIYGIEHSTDLNAELLLAPPFGCAAAFNEGVADVALIPIAGLHKIGNGRIITPYCIGANQSVRTVVVLSRCHIDRVETIYLDNHSLSSVKLCRILAREYWGIEPHWKPLADYSTIDKASQQDAFLLIGDKVFDYEKRFEYRYDLADCWRAMTGLPFVFAVWIAREGVEQEFVDRLSGAISNGLQHIDNAIEYYGHADKPYAYDYLTKNISFDLDENKRAAMDLFLKKIEKY